MALELLTVDNGEEETNVVRLRRQDGVWLVEYETQRADHANGEPLVCAAAETEIRLVEGERTRVAYTTSDMDIFELAIPDLGVEMTAIPGRLDEVWLDPGMVTHGSVERSKRDNSDGTVLISVRVLNRTDYDNWLATTVSPNCD